MRRLLSFLFVVLFSASVLSAATLPELYQKVKQQFRMRSYAEALQGVERLRSDCQKPENERYREALQPSIAFYRGACLAALGRGEEARGEFEVFLAFEPNASLDPAIYPKPVIAALEDTRKSLRQKRETPDETGSMASAYRAFRGDVPSKEDDPGQEWAEGPVRVLLTPEQRRDYEHMPDPVSRSEFVTAFWKSRDPRPETVENEFRMEFERRVAFADAHLTDGEVRGSLTDRGTAFLLLGPPTYVGRRPIRAGEDANAPSGDSLYSRNDLTVALSGGGNTLAKYDKMTGPESKMLEPSSNWREVWHYRRELLPRAVPYLQVDLEFITRKGYGKNVLQRDPAALNTLDAARKAAPEWAVNRARRPS